ncbi:ParB/RepB/Spo0J family partition protein [Aliarcobacter butzleri]|uniref:ParB/RepB/Spo0J family partition protein n=1 Tax=Aliarcobacter butzleri TaxID=28197 RepID=UPI003B222A87
MDFSKIKDVTAGKTKTSGISPFSELEISKVYPNPEQPRKQFDDIEELASTIKEHGLLQPITVVKKDDGYMIVSGERRYKAHLFNEAKTIKAHIIDVSEDEIEELALIENIQRNDLTDFEIAKGIVKRWNSGKYEKKSDLAKKIGKSESYVSKAFSALKLNDEILEDIATNKKDISVSVMDEISRVKDKDVQKEVYQKYNAGEITRDDIKEYKEPIGLKTVYAGGFRFTARYSTIVNFSFLVARHNNTFLEEDKNYNCIVEKINKEQDFFQTKDELLFTLKANKKNLEDLEKLGSEWIKIANSLLKNKIYRFTITLSTFQEKPINEPKSEKEETNIALQKYEDAEKDLIDQAETFNENFPTGNLEATFKVGDLVKNTDNTNLQMVGDKIVVFGKSDKAGKSLCIEDFGKFFFFNYGDGEYKLLESDSSYRLIIERMEKAQYIDDAKEVVSNIKRCMCNQTKRKGKNVIGGKMHGTVLDNDYEIAIFDLLKELHNLKENQTVQDNSILDTPKVEIAEKPIHKKEIKLLELFGETVTISYTDDDVDMGLDYKKAKKIINESTQTSIPFDVCKGTVERAYRLINTDTRTIKDDYIVFIDKKEDDAKRSI